MVGMGEEMYGMGNEMYYYGADGENGEGGEGAENEGGIADDGFDSDEALFFDNNDLANRIWEDND